MPRYAVVRFFDEDSPTWAEYAPRFLRLAPISKNTIRGTYGPAINHFTRFLADPLIRIAGVAVAKANDYAAFVKSGMSHNSFITRVGAVRAVFSYALKEAVIQSNPFALIDLPKPIPRGRALSDSEILRIVKQLSWECQRAVFIALYTGMRRGEVISLQWKQLGEDSILIPAHKAKSGRERVLKFNPRLWKFLGKPKRPDDYVLNLSAQDLNEEFTAAWKALDLGQIRFHDLRHTAATRFFEKSDDLGAAMAAFGWASAVSAEPYIRHMTAKRQGKMLGIDYRMP